MPVKVTISTSEDQDARLEKLRVIMNEQRAEQGKPPFDTVNAMSKSALIDQLKGWEEMALSDVNQQFNDLFSVASDADRQQCMDILLPPDDA